MWTEQMLDERLATPSPALIEDMKKLKGDIVILGAGGKMGPTMCLLAKNAIEAAGLHKKVYAVSRFSDPVATKLLQDNGIEIHSVDLMEPGAMSRVPDAENVIYMAGRKFGTNGQEPFTWAMNAWLPALVAERYKKSGIVVFSSGNLYPIVRISSGGVTEEVKPEPIGEYAMSCLARERCFEYGALQYGTKVLLYRLNYAVDLRYGVLYDIASKIYKGETLAVNNPCFNCIWQGDANEIALRSLLYTESPAAKLNVTGPEIVSTRWAAREFARLFGVEAKLEGEELDDAYLNNSAKCMALFGYPSVSLKTMIEWQAEWIAEGGRALNKPTHFEERKGKY